MTDRLGLPCNDEVAVGRVYVNFLGKSRIGRLNLWSLSSEGIVSSADIRDHLDWLLDKLTSRAAALLALQDEDGVRMSVECLRWSMYKDSFGVVWPEQMSALADLNLELSWILLYDGAPDDEEDSELDSTEGD